MRVAACDRGKAFLDARIGVTAVMRKEKYRGDRDYQSRYWRDPEDL
jgi:hypothetical protein